MPSKLKGPRAGELHHRVTLMRLGESDWSPTNQTGEPIAVGTYWAQVKPLQGREAVEAAQIVASVSHKVTMRVVGPITTQDWLVFQGRKLSIGSVVRPNEANDFYEILASEQK